MNLMHLLDLLLTPGVLAPLATIASVVVAAFLAVRATNHQSKDLNRQLRHQAEQARIDRVRDRDAQLRRDRLEVYRRYLEACHKVTATFDAVEDGTWEQRKAGAEAADIAEWNVRTEVSLLGSPKVKASTRKMHSLQQDRRLEWAQLWDPTRSQERASEPGQNPVFWGTAVDPLVAEVSHLIYLMHKEMTAGVEDPKDDPAPSAAAE